MIGYIRTYDNGTGVGVVFVIEEEMTLPFSDGGGSGFTEGQKVSLKLGSNLSENWVNPAIVSDVMGV